MRPRSGLRERLLQMCVTPPVWLRWLYVPVSAVLVFGVAQRRGWTTGAFAAVIYGGMSFAMALEPAGAVSWSKRHPRADSALLGPLLFLALTALTSVPGWWCVLGGFVGLLLGVALGARRKRLLTNAGANELTEDEGFADIPPGFHLKPKDLTPTRRKMVEEMERKLRPRRRPKA